MGLVGGVKMSCMNEWICFNPLYFVVIWKRMWLVHWNSCAETHPLRNMVEAFIVSLLWVSISRFTVYLHLCYIENLEREKRDPFSQDVPLHGSL